jgi:hypothetical protein
MGWQYGLILVGLLFVIVIAAVLCICAHEHEEYVPYSKVNDCKPGVFSVGKDLK